MRFSEDIPSRGELAKSESAWRSARPADARRMIFTEGVVLTLICAAAGLVLSLGAGKLLASVLYKVSGLRPAGAGLRRWRSDSGFDIRLLAARAARIARGSDHCAAPGVVARLFNLGKSMAGRRFSRRENAKG